VLNAGKSIISWVLRILSVGKTPLPKKDLDLVENKTDAAVCGKQ